MNVLATSKRTAAIAALVEGTSINATCRMAGVSKHTVLKLLEGMGCACAAYHNTHVRNLRVRRVQADEIWSFVYGKDKNLTLEQVQSGLGSVWTWKAIDADTKLVISYTIGDRGADTAKAFMEDVASRVSTRIQLTTDGILNRATAQLPASDAVPEFSPEGPTLITSQHHLWNAAICR